MAKGACLALILVLVPFGASAISLSQGLQVIPRILDGGDWDTELVGATSELSRPAMSMRTCTIKAATHVCLTFVSLGPDIACGDNQSSVFGTLSMAPGQALR
jgi:hypothetical protein